jgi:hypothetical protein
MRTKTAAMAILGWAVLALGVAAPFALGLEETANPKKEYVDQAEPICKTNVLANKRIFKGAKEEVQKGELKRASTHFFRAATAFGKTVQQLNAISKPAEYTTALNKWFGLLRNEKSIIEKIGRALAAEDKHKAENVSVELNRNSNKANNAVLGWGFNYCRIEPSRFG